MLPATPIQTEVVAPARSNVCSVPRVAHRRRLREGNTEILFIRNLAYAVPIGLAIVTIAKQVAQGHRVRLCPHCSRGPHDTRRQVIRRRNAHFINASGT
jgi:hypothetical protein